MSKYFNENYNKLPKLLCCLVIIVTLITTATLWLFPGHSHTIILSQYTTYAQNWFLKTKLPKPKANQTSNLMLSVKIKHKNIIDEPLTWKAMYSKPAVGGYTENAIDNLKNAAPARCPGNLPCISMGTGYFNGYRTWERQIKMFKTNGNKTCKYQCDFVTDMAQADAVLFHGRDFGAPLPWKRRDPNQTFIYVSLESPIATRQIGYNLEADLKYRYIFNMSATYVRTSDIYVPHGMFVERETPLPASAKLYDPSTKKILALATISNCKPFNDRNQKVGKLSSLLGANLEKFGYCFGHYTPGQYDPKQFNEISKKYRFFIAYENSFCRDYITEKVFNNGLATECIPVVFGGLSKEEYEYMTPPNSFIYARDFPTMQKLVDYMKMVAGNETLYATFHEWKRKYKMVGTTREDATLCRICEKLWKTQNQRSTTDIADYYNVTYNCLPPSYTNYLL